MKMNSIMNDKIVKNIDETGFNKNMIPNYGFAIKNQKCYVPVLPKSKNYSVISAVTSETLMGIQIFEGSITVIPKSKILQSGPKFSIKFKIKHPKSPDLIEPSKICLFLSSKLSHNTKHYY
jgi:hypothetical protein